MLSKKDVILEEKECAEMLGMSLEEYRKDVKNIKVSSIEKKTLKDIEYDNSILDYLGICEKDLKKKNIQFFIWEGRLRKKANIGDIWLAIIPKIYLNDELGDMNVLLEKRPCLIVDDGRGFIIEENSNYSGLKLTTRKSKINKVRRKEIKNWYKLGLKKKSYVRIELPIKIEEQQLLLKIGSLSFEDMKVYLRELANYFNVDVLEKLLDENKIKTTR